ncbi:hypothetical protein TOPH_02637 [Tolypocladium ophioglossoides CBS 100239]|uniref:Uncharacterized protein n=1 Tax=Tolypocladium ophioglossoides (strain CBS 100239) TaxID=1163406 RepID=A0A0L0NEP6_TOLOC|nr:hypothetical protein TOPH_02637 [Tolypocladium ophioglossoides CBS 100239]
MGLLRDKTDSPCHPDTAQPAIDIEIAGHIEISSIRHASGRGAVESRDVGHRACVSQDEGALAD